MDVVIVGAGPAGIAAAIQLRRSGVDFLLFEQKEIGGLLLNAHLVENYPGFPQGISGPDLVQKFKQQLERWEIPVSPGSVDRVEYRDGAFQVTTGGRELTGRFLVIASGTVAHRLPASVFQGEAEGRIFYEVSLISGICGRHVGIVGAGDAALDYGLQLAEHNRVTIFCRGDGPCCLPLLAKRAEEADSLDLRLRSQLQAVEKTGKGLLLHVATEGEPQGQALEVDYLLAAVGRSPALGFLGPSLESSEEKLSWDGCLYFAGDVKNDLYRQTGICVGDGIKAAMQIYERLRKMKS